MSKHIPLIPAVEGKVWEGHYCVSSAVVRTTSAGKFFSDVTLADKSGSVVAKYWDNWEDKGYGTGKILNIALSTEKYNGNLSYKIVGVEEAEDEVDEADIVPVVSNLADLKKQALLQFDSISNPFLRIMIKSIYTDKVMESAAGITGPFAMKGGLISLALSVCCDATALHATHSAGDPDIIRAASFLSCFGYSKTTPIVNYFPTETASELLLGQSNVAISEIMSYWHGLQPWKAEHKDEQEEARFNILKISHIIASIAGTVVPATIEAIIVKNVYSMVLELEQAKFFIDRNQGSAVMTGFDPVGKRKYLAVK